MQTAANLALLLVLIPTRTWYPPSMPPTVRVEGQGQMVLLLNEFTGRPIETTRPVTASAGMEVNLLEHFPALASPGTYILRAAPADGKGPGFLGTPLIVSVRRDRRLNAPPGAMVTKVQPLQYVRLDTDRGPLDLALFYDSAPHTVDNFLLLCREGFYDGLAFHRIIPGFVIQAGDPTNTGTGGPGYRLEAEFNDHKHEPGVVSMARSVDPAEASGVMPRAEYADSAGSQFFICLERLERLDRRYTAFAKVTRGMEVVNAIAACAPATQPADGPRKTPIIRKAQVRPVTIDDNPYAALAPLPAKE